MTANPRYVEAAIAGALADFDRDAGPGNVNEPYFALACRLLELAHAGALSEDEAERLATGKAHALGHAKQSIKDTWKSAQRETAGKAAVIPEPAHKNGRTLTPRPAPQGYANLAAYAQAHGVPAEVFEAAGWSDATLWEVQSKDGPRVTNQKPQRPIRERRAVRFESDAGPRWRLLDGDAPKYWHPYGSHKDDNKAWYKLGQALRLAEGTGGPLVLVNGEPAAVVAQHYGIPATCETGGGEHEICPQLLAELLEAWPGAFIVPADCDAKGRKAAPQKAAQLRDAGRDARAVTLGALSEHGDLADFCTLHQHRARAALLERPELAEEQPATLAARGGVHIHWGEEIDQITAPRQLIKGYLTTSSVALFIGPSEAGKSTIAVDVACKVSQYYPVVYVAGEDAGNVRTQIRAWELTTQERRGRLGLVDGPVLLGEDASVNAFLDAVLPAAPRLIIFDTLSSCIPGLDENSSEMTVVSFNLNRIADTTGATVLALHHPLKYDAGTFRGHSSLLNNTHTMWAAEKDDGDDTVTLKVTRHKGPRAEPATLKLLIRPTDIYDPDDGQLSAPVAVPASRIIQTDDHLSRRQRAILEFLEGVDFDGGATTAEICRTIAAQEKTQEGVVRKDVNSLAKRGMIGAFEGQGKPRQITEKGKARIGLDRVDQVDRVVPSDPFIINVKLGETLTSAENPIRDDAAKSRARGSGFEPSSDDDDTNPIQPDPRGVAHQGAPNYEPDPTRSEPDPGGLDRVPFQGENPIHPDPVSYTGSGGSGFPEGEEDDSELFAATPEQPSDDDAIERSVAQELAAKLAEMKARRQGGAL